MEDILVKQSVPESEPVGVGGWLFFLCLSLTVFGPLLYIGGLFDAYQQLSPLFFDPLFSALFGRFPRFYLLIIVHYTMIIGIMGFGMYAGIALWKQAYGAVRIAKRYLFAILLHPVVWGILSWMTELPSEAPREIFGDVLAFGFRSLVFFAVWYSYLTKSRRVQNTFQPMEPTL